MKRIFVLAPLVCIIFCLPCLGSAKQPSLSKAQQERLRSMENDPATAKDPYLKSLIHEVKTSSGHKQQQNLSDLENGVQTKKLLLSNGSKSASPEMPSDASAQAQKILSSPVYAKPGNRSYGNWIKRAVERMFHPKLDPPKLNPPDISEGIGPAAQIVMWAVIIAFLLIFAYLAYLLFGVPGKRKKRGAIASEDEAAADSDEWLERSAEWAKRGDYRQAIRCAYIAGLLYFDSARLARFDRTETNWQHLARIEKSPNLLPGVQYHQETALFDGVWYGMRPVGSADYENFLSSIKQLKTILGIRGSNSRETPDYDVPAGSKSK